jgi:two-component system chemotaxis response regulator CheY
MKQCLMVEASPDDRRRLEPLLAQYGFSVEAADTAEEALEQCRRFPPQLMLIPDRPGSMDSVSFIQRLRRLAGRRAPIVLLFGEAGDPVEIGRAIWEGASECLMKPFDPEILDLKLRQAGAV